MYHSNKELLMHILDEVRFVLNVTTGINQDNLIENETLKRAVVRSIEIIGEASKKIDPDFKTLHPHIDWKGMAGTRDKLIHDYFGVNYIIVWDIIINELPPLNDFLETLITGK
jgi:uncharacterized protein with HEPN domain